MMAVTLDKKLPVSAGSDQGAQRASREDKQPLSQPPSQPPSQAPSQAPSQPPLQPRPDIVRRTTELPSPSGSLSTPPSRPPPPLPSQARNRSPYAHTRSRSTASVLSPPMTRAHSSPLVPSVSSTSFLSTSPSASPRIRPSSPLRSPGHRAMSPFGSLPDESPSSSAANSPFYDGGIESISEDAELNIKPRPVNDYIPQPIPLHATLNSSRPLNVRRQRPTSPLHSVGAQSSRSSSGASSPSHSQGRFTEAYPALHHYSSASSFSSIPSTPTSSRSRSPSVSSLETIEDTPDLEWEAIESDRKGRAKAAAEAAERGEDSGDDDGRRRGSLEIPGARTSVGFGFGRRGEGSRKRWSVCGGERRADLDLETIWED